MAQRVGVVIACPVLFASDLVLLADFHLGQVELQVGFDRDIDRHVCFVLGLRLTWAAERSQVERHPRRTDTPPARLYSIRAIGALTE